MGFFAEGWIAGRRRFLQDMANLAGGGEIAAHAGCWPRAGGGILHGVVVRL